VCFAFIDGYFDGNLRASEQVVLERNARVFGSIHTPSLAIRDGAAFYGDSVVEAKGPREVLIKDH
jgi:cytoskeletal protein CcmA (bactofilin family)